MNATLLAILIAHRYSLLIPLAFVEGHVISLIVGFLARLGYLNAFIGGTLVIIGNLLGDMCLYWLGYHKGEKVARSWGKYIGVTDQSIGKAREIFHAHKSKILFVSKVTNGFGLAMAVLFTAGMSRIPFKTFMFWNTIGECIWTGFLVSMGYFLGHLYITIDSIIWRVGVVTGSVLFIFILYRVNAYIKQKI
jgi:membrane protein DedA with SNARE-associated domain